MDPATPIHERSDLHEDAIALTFDDGPSEWTEAILDTLARNAVKATFFVVGEAITEREAILVRTVAEGHEVGNHTFSHPRLDEVSADEVERQVALGRRTIEEVIGLAPTQFRLPGFQHNADVLRVVGACGYRWAIQASVFPADFRMTSHSDIADEVMNGVQRGSIVGLHDGKPPSEPPFAAGGSRDDREPTVAAVEAIVPTLIDRGYRFCTISELLEL